MIDGMNLLVRSFVTAHLRHTMGGSSLSPVNQSIPLHVRSTGFLEHPTHLSKANIGKGNPSDTSPTTIPSTEVLLTHSRRLNNSPKSASRLGEWFPGAPLTNYGRGLAASPFPLPRSTPSEIQTKHACSACLEPFHRLCQDFGFKRKGLRKLFIPKREGGWRALKKMPCFNSASQRKLVTY